MTDRILVLLSVALLFIAVFAGTTAAPDWLRGAFLGAAIALSVIAAVKVGEWL